MKEIKLENYVGKDSINIGNFTFKANERIDFDPKKKRYLLSSDKKKCEAFNNLCSLYNEKINDYNRRVKDEISSTYQDIHNKLETMEGGNISNVELFLNSQIQERINSFRGTKDVLIKKLDESEKKLKNLKVWNIKKKMETKAAIEAARKALNNLKSARREAKKTAKAKGKAVITSRTFYHSIINFEGINNLPTYNGIIGSLIAVAYFINNYKGDNKLKNLKLKQINEAQKLLEGGSKSYENSLKTFNIGVGLAEKISKNNPGTQEDLNKMKGLMDELKRSMDEFIAKGLQEIKGKKTNSGIKRCANKMKKDFDTNKGIWATTYASSLGTNGIGNIELVNTFIDVYFQSKALAVFKGIYKEKDQSSVATSISVGVFQIVAGAACCAVCPAGVILLACGIANLYIGLFNELNTSEFDNNASVLNAAEAEQNKKATQGAVSV